MESSLTTNTQAIGLLNSNVETLDLRVDALHKALQNTNKQVTENMAGIAIANALSGSTWLQSNEDYAVSANWGYFDGTSALALSAAARVDHNWSANWAIGISPQEGEVGARGGIRFGW